MDKPVHAIGKSLDVGNLRSSRTPVHIGLIVKIARHMEPFHAISTQTHATIDIPK